MHDTASTVAFCAAAFGATGCLRLVEPSGRIGHAELQPRPTLRMPADASCEFGLNPPPGDTGIGCSMHPHADECRRLLAGRRRGRLDPADTADRPVLWRARLPPARSVRPHLADRPLDRAARRRRDAARCSALFEA
jgi:hypothetical protein